MERKLNIAFFWHMHQPLYKDTSTGEYILPWVLLHGTKDYLDMVSILDEFPEIHQTFNFVPSLIEQLNDYSTGKNTDRYRAAAMKPASTLTPNDKSFILRNFFQADWNNMVRPVPRYWELLKLRGFSGTPDEIESSSRYFTAQDLVDLQVLFNLVWVDPKIREDDEFLRDLYRKGRGYTEEEKIKLFGKQTEIMGRILPKYREMQDRGIIEVTTSPYYHPIMPLLCDSFSAREAMPDVTLPGERFRHPEDALRQIEMGIRLHKETFGSAPKGLWPPEGSVSMDMIPLAAEAGINWIATDEDILSLSTGRTIHRDGSGNCKDSFLYVPYSIETEDRQISIVFRDRVLSDLIGFDYAKMESREASEDLVNRLVHIKDLVGEPEEHMVSIILDGENAWECYKNDGRDFLVSLYTKLIDHPHLRCVTISEFLSSREVKERLPRVFSGSWINHNFSIWIGHVEDNTAWDHIKEARDTLKEFERSLGSTPDSDSKRSSLEHAWRELYASEGSDWFWWYGDDHTTTNDEDFDNLFRAHLKRVYTLIGMEPPAALEVPIISRERSFVPEHLPTAFIKPVIDGEVTNYFEWLEAGRIQRRHLGSAMHREIEGGGLIEKIFYGFSKEVLFFRFDYLSEVMPYTGEWRLMIHFLGPKTLRIQAVVLGGFSKGGIFEESPAKEQWLLLKDLELLKSGDIVEIGIPFKDLGAKSGDEMRFFITIDAGARGIERWPVKGFLVQEVPSEDFEKYNWIV